MKSIKFDSYGGQEKMYWIDEAIPSPKEKQILVKVKAVSINPIDWKVRNGEMKLFIDKKFPKGLGSDFSGIVESIGSNESKFKKGDEVFGWLSYQMAGSVAEYCIADENMTAFKPANMSFVEASTLPMACFATMTALIDNGKIKKGDSVLINGCTGGVGQFAVMIAKNFSATVTGTCSTNSIETAKQLGVDNIIDFTKLNVLQGSRKFDIIFDTAGNLKFSQSKEIMNDKSIFLELNPNPINLIFGGIKNIFSSKKVKSIIAKASPEKLDVIAIRASQGNLKPIIGKQYEFNDALTAYKNMENGEKNIGKTVIINKNK